MLITLTILQLLIIQVLNQTHQQLIAQRSPPVYTLPAFASTHLQACLRGRCSEGVTLLKTVHLYSNDQRQFYSASLQICEQGQCRLTEQVFSEGSAILKEELQHHSIIVK